MGYMAKATIVIAGLGVGVLACIFFVAGRTDSGRVCYESRRDKLGLLSEGMVDSKNRFKITMWCAIHGNPPGGWPIDAHR
jgi:hypothetical protein